MKGYAAVLWHDGQGGALLRAVAKLDKFESETVEALEMELPGGPTIECSHGSRSGHVYLWRRGNPGEEDPQCRPWKWTSCLACGHT